MQASVYLSAFTTDVSIGVENTLHLAARIPKQLSMTLLAHERQLLKILSCSANLPGYGRINQVLSGNIPYPTKK